MINGRFYTGHEALRNLTLTMDVHLKELVRSLTFKSYMVHTDTDGSLIELKLFKTAVPLVTEGFLRIIPTADEGIVVEMAEGVDDASHWPLKAGVRSKPRES